MMVGGKRAGANRTNCRAEEVAQGIALKRPSTDANIAHHAPLLKRGEADVDGPEMIGKGRRDRGSHHRRERRRDSKSEP